MLSTSSDKGLLKWCSFFDRRTGKGVLRIQTGVGGMPRSTRSSAAAVKSTTVSPQSKSTVPVKKQRGKATKTAAAPSNVKAAKRVKAVAETGQAVEVEGSAPRNASAMQRYVALLRGINVGGRRVKMDRLRAIFGAMGYSDVSTFIASGNVIFSTPSTDLSTLAAEVSAGLHDQLGFAVDVFLRTADELAAVAAHSPPGHTEDRALYVVFLQSPASDALRQQFASVDSPADRFSYSPGGQEVFWSIGSKISESPLFGGKFDKTVKGHANTTRNITSVKNLVAKLGMN